MNDFFSQISSFISGTKVPEQISEVEFVGLFTNPWFIVPFAILVVYMLWKQSFKELVIIAVFIGVWWVSGTDYMQTLVVGEELQLSKVLPVMFGGAVALGLVIYLLFGRSD